MSPQDSIGPVDAERWRSSDAQQREALARELILPRVLELGGTLLDADFNPSQRLRNRYANAYAELVDGMETLPDWREHAFGHGFPYVARCFQSLLARTKDASASELARIRAFAPLWVVDVDDPSIPAPMRESVRCGAETAVSRHAGWLPDNVLDLLEQNQDASKPRRTIRLRSGDAKTEVRNGELVFVGSGAALKVDGGKETLQPVPDWSGSVRFVSLGKARVAAPAAAAASVKPPLAPWWIRVLALAPAVFYPIGLAAIGELLQAMVYHLLWLFLFSCFWIARRRLRLPSLWRYWLLSSLPLLLIIVLPLMGMSVRLDRQSTPESWMLVLGACLWSAISLFFLFKKPVSGRSPLS